QQIGCEDLRDAIRRRSSLKVIVFGHVHHSYGAQREDNKWFINAAQYNGIFDGDLRNKPIQVLLRRQDKTVYNIHGLSL
ncbi:unnamed protein product, partial [Rotaria sp. Silwood2]